MYTIGSVLASSPTTLFLPFLPTRRCSGDELVRFSNECLGFSPWKRGSGGASYHRNRTRKSRRGRQVLPPLHVPCRYCSLVWRERRGLGCGRWGRLWRRG